MFTRSIRIIVLACLVYVLGVNYVFFSLAQDNFANNDWTNVIVYAHTNVHQYEYRGFAYFYKYLETFPGLANSMNTIQNVVAVLGNEIKYTGWTVLDYFLGILMIIGSPVQLLICFIIDIINMLIWLFSFFVPNFFS